MDTDARLDRIEAKLDQLVGLLTQMLTMAMATSGSGGPSSPGVPGAGLPPGML